PGVADGRRQVRRLQRRRPVQQAQRPRLPDLQRQIQLLRGNAMHHSGLLHAALLAVALGASAPLLAQVSAEQAARLGRDLTPMGAEMAGNAAGSIPAWSGGLAKDSAAFDPQAGYKDPYAADQPLYSVSHANAAQYREQLSPGQLAMLQRYADSWKLKVYPS